MKNKIVNLLSILILVAFAIPAYASSALQVWSCDLRDGKTRAEAEAVSAAWLKAAKGMNGGDQLEVYLNFPIVTATNSEHFGFVLIAPSLEAWGVFNGGYEGSPAAKADEDWSKVAVCSGNSLWESVKIE